MNGTTYKPLPPFSQFLSDLLWAPHDPQARKRLRDSSYPGMEFAKTPDEEKKEPACSNCGIRPAPYSRPCYDICPTDRGDERRDYTEHFCEDCWNDPDSH